MAITVPVLTRPTGLTHPTPALTKARALCYTRSKLRQRYVFSPESGYPPMKICLLNILHDALDKRMYHKIARSLFAAGHEVVPIAPGTEETRATLENIRWVPVPEAQGNSFGGHRGGQTRIR